MLADTHMEDAHGAPQDGAVGLRYLAPPEELWPYFGSIYHFSVNRPHYDDITRADMGQLRFMRSGAGHYEFHDGTIRTTPDVCLLGPTMGATAFHLTAPVDVIGVSLLPLGWLSLGGCDSSHLADGLFALAEFDPEYGAFLEKLREYATVEDAAPAVWEFLGERLNPVAPGMIAFISAVDSWLADDGSPRVDSLVKATGLSGRQLARLTNRLYGGPPKLLARKYRALRCAWRIVIDQQPWQELCEDGTFYDQSHFIREIRHFVGLTPHQLMNSPTEVARLTLQRRELGGDLSELNRIS